MNPGEFFAEVWDRYGDPGTFVDRVQATLRRYGISQRRLAERIGMDPASLSGRIGASRRYAPRMETMVQIDEALTELVQEVQALEAADH